VVGSTISHYRITDKLGEGGMGVVYKAEDTKLRRTVALKFPPVDRLENEEEKARFVREAQAAAALNHPNICTVYEIDEADGRTFIAMEFVDGRSVKAKLREPPLPLDDALEIAAQAAQGLQAAHEAGIVHRDIKSANLMVTGRGQVKVMDFGLAQVGDRSQLTKTGTTLGTAAYMSPEQAIAEPTDRRTDICSLGVVIDEMRTGHLPFGGEVEAAVAYAVVNTEPQPPTAVRSGLPVELDYLIEKALAKDREERYQHIEEMLVDLRALQKGAPEAVRVKAPARSKGPARLHRRSVLLAVAGLLVALLALAVVLNPGGWRERMLVSSTPSIDSLAILPLQNLSGDPEQKYFSDGMTEALYTDLAKISALKVISPRSTQKYEGTDTTIRQIAGELGVDAIVLGSAMRTGDHVRITAQLVDAESDTNLWAESFERDFTNVLALQSELAQAIARQVQAELTPGEAVRLAGAQPVNVEAYEACLKGQFHYRELSPQGLETALWYYESALEKDPDYAPAHASVARVWLSRQQMGFVASHEASPKIWAALMKALELDNTLADVQGTLALLRFLTEWDWEGAETAFRRAIELNPNHPGVRALYAHLLMILGRTDEAMEQSERALELDPFHVRFQLFHSHDLLFARRYDEAIAQLQNVVKSAPNNPGAHFGLWHTFHAKGMHKEAVEAAKAAYASTGYGEAVEALELGYRNGDCREAMSLAAEALAARSNTTFTLPTETATLYAFAGMKDQALKWLDKGFDARDPNMVYIGVYPVFDLLRDDPRFQELLRRMNLPQ
jgi:serine/threonine-protein kinase